MNAAAALSAAAALAARCVAMAIEQFEDEGEITPKVVLEAPTFVMVVWPAGESGDLPAWAHRVIGTLGGVGGVTAAALMCEAWYTAAPAGPEPPHLEPGELARREAAGDTGVKTSVVIAATDGTETVTDVRRPKLADDGTVGWQDDYGPRLSVTGRLPRLVTEALAHARAATPAEVTGPLGLIDLAEYAKALQKMAPLFDAEIALVALVVDE